MTISIRWVGLIVFLVSISECVVHAQDVPKILNVSPATPHRGDVVTITGQHFGDLPGVLWVGTAPVVTSTWHDGQITATIPNDAASGSLAVLRTGPPAQWSESQLFVFPSPPVTNNGISVNDVKVYDNAALQQMLDSARARLASLQFVDQTGIAAHLGAIQGATSQQSGFAFNIGGPSVPGVQTTANTGNTATTASQSTGGQTNSGGTTTTTTTPGTEQLQVTGPSTTSTTAGSTGSTVTGPSTQTVTTLAQQNAAVPSVPATTSVSTPSFSPSASNILNEQVQLNSEAAGLALLLEGSLTDQTFRVIDPASGQPIIIPKQRVTIGIPVSILPMDKYKGDAAEVIVTVTARDTLLSPSITAILPQDKTYNVASINSKSVNLGAGVVTGVLSAGMNWLWQKQTYYIVQDQDTVALQLPPDPAAPNKISFGWQIRPVLGQRTVSSGMRTLFVQLAIPVTGAQLNLAKVTVTTRWKKIDSKTNVVSDIAIADTPIAREIPIPVYDLAPGIENVDDPIDNGDGTVTVHIMSHTYISGTYIKVAGNVISQGAANALFDPTHIDFTIPANVLANNKGYLVSRAGAYSEIINPQIAGDTTDRCLTITSPKVSPESSASAIVTAGITLGTGDAQCLLNGKKLSDLHVVALVGNKVFGYRDAPITTDDTTNTISFRAPVDLMRNSPSLTVERMLWGQPFRDTQSISVPLIPTINTVTVIKKSSDGIQMALIGSSLRQLTPPDGMTLTGDSDTGRILSVPPKSSAGLSQIVLKTASGDLLLVAMPTDTTTTSPALETHASIQAGQSTMLTLKGSHLDEFLRVELNRVKIAGAKLSADKKSIIVPLSARGVKSPGIELTLYFGDSHPVTYKIDVFDNHNEVLQPAATTAGQQAIKN